MKVKSTSSDLPVYEVYLYKLIPVPGKMGLDHWVRFDHLGYQSGENPESALRAYLAQFPTHRAFACISSTPGRHHAKNS